MADKDVKKNVYSIGLGMLGIVIFGIHAALLYYNPSIFNVVVCLYVMTYAFINFVTINKNKVCYDKGIFNFLINSSLYTICLEFLLLLLSIILTLHKKS